MRKRGLLLAALVVAFGSYATADSIRVGTLPPDVQDCLPFGCSLHAQFIYDASYFPVPVTITGLTFFNSVEDSPDTFDPGFYTFLLSTTSATVASPSSTYADNRGGDFQIFDVESPAGPYPPSFTFFGAPFTYNPINGNLLLEVNKTGSDAFSGFTDYNSGDGFLVSRVWGNDPDTGSIDRNYGPVTEFELGQQAVPEPATLTLTGLGIIGVVSWRLRKGRKASTPSV